MARCAETLRGLAYDLYADEPLVQERRFWIGCMFQNSTSKNVRSWDQRFIRV